MALRFLCLLAAATSTLATPIIAEDAAPQDVSPIMARQTGSDPNYCVGTDYPCTSGVLVLGARGGDPNSKDPLSVSPLYGDLQGMEDIAKPLIAKAGGYCRGLPYAAAGLPWYGNSVDVGTIKTQTIIKNYVDKCGPNSRIILLGYSAGAQAETAALVGKFPAVTPFGMIFPLASKYKKNVIGGAFFGSPSFRHGYSPIDAGNATTDGPVPLDALTYSSFNRNFGDRIRNYCQDKDASCADGGLGTDAVAIHLNALKFFRDDAVNFLSQFL